MFGKKEHMGCTKGGRVEQSGVKRRADVKRDRVPDSSPGSTAVRSPAFPPSSVVPADPETALHRHHGSAAIPPLAARPHLHRRLRAEMLPVPMALVPSRSEAAAQFCSDDRKLSQKQQCIRTADILL